MSDCVKISVLLLAQNGEKHVRRCLDSLIKFDEIVFVDGGSSDKTIELAKSYKNVVVYENSWPGFVEQRNYSLLKATHQWCFMIDIDESIDESLVDEIYNVVNNSPDKPIYRIIRSEFYEGSQLKGNFGATSPQLRLLDKNRVSYTGGVHHTHLIDGIDESQAEHLIGNFDPKFRIYHDDKYNFIDWVLKLPRFSLLIGEEKVNRGRKTNVFVVLCTLFFTFFQIYKKSWRDGRIGFIIAVQETVYRTLMRLFIYRQTHFSSKDEGLLKSKYLL